MPKGAKMFLSENLRSVRPLSSSTKMAVWIFGYDCLIYEVDFPNIDKVVGSIQGSRRRYRMASQDHRGKLHKPGKVLTVQESPSEACFGTAKYNLADS